MNYDDYTAFRKGTFTKEGAMRSMITEVGAGLYTYMVMLELAGRTGEAEFYKCIRTRVFEIRAHIQHDVTNETLDRLSGEMELIHRELETARIFLLAHSPKEVCLLQSVTNTACGLIHTIKHFADKD